MQVWLVDSFNKLTNIKKVRNTDYRIRIGKKISHLYVTCKKNHVASVNKEGDYFLLIVP